MLILIICIIVFLLPLLSDDGSWFIMSSIPLVAIIGIAISAQMLGRTNIELYNVDKNYIESQYKNTKMSGDERKQVIELMLKDNSIIVSNRLWRDSLILGIFNYDKVGDLELFDINKLPVADNNITVKK
jgi:hypothetical protein